MFIGRDVLWCLLLEIKSAAKPICLKFKKCAADDGAPCRYLLFNYSPVPWVIDGSAETFTIKLASWHEIKLFDRESRDGVQK